MKLLTSALSIVSQMTIYPNLATTPTRGVLDLVDTNRISGWVTRLEDASTPLSVIIEVDDVFLKQLACTIYRKGVHQQGLHPTGICGFELRLDADHKLKPGQIVRVVESETRTELTNSPWQITEEQEKSNTDYPQYAPRKLFFMHIAKTAGSSLNDFLAQHFNPARVQTHIENTDFRQNPEFSRRHDFLSGHVRVSEARSKLDLQGFYSITLIREPISHLASHLRWLKFIAQDQSSAFFRNHPENIKDLAMTMQSVNFSDPDQLDRFLRQDDSRIKTLFNNCQTRYFLRPGHQLNLSGADFAHAKQALQFFDLIGITDQYDEFLIEICSLMDWEKSKSIKRLNTQGKQFGLDINNPETRSIMEKQLQYDFALYDIIQKSGGILKRQ